MYVERIVAEGLAQVAYLVGDELSREAAIIDPRRESDVYLNAAQARGFRIAAILETHVHADFVSGALELAERSGAAIYSNRLGQQEFPLTPLDDGDELAIGSLRLRALWSPGHTPEHTCSLLFDAAGPDMPRALFSGDMLFVGEVGRPDLLGAEQTGRLVEQLYASIFERLMPLPDSLIVYPGHGAGSSCGRSIGSAPSTTMGQEKRFNYAFRPRTLDEFRHSILDGMPLPPTYYPFLKVVNRVGPRLLRDLPHGHPLTPADVSAHSSRGALIIDAGSPEAFAGGHIPGSVSVGLNGDFIAWAGWLAPYDRDIVLILEHDSQFEHARQQLRLIGLDRVLGYLQGGLDAWERAGYDLASYGSISVHELNRRLRDGERVTVLDVRSDGEWNEGRIRGAVHRFAGLIARGTDGLPTDGVLAVICAGGYRSSVVASLLDARGHAGVVDVLGGMDAWRAAGYETAG